jgi:hypothetical protein
LTSGIEVLMQTVMAQQDHYTPVRVGNSRVGMSVLGVRSTSRSSSRDMATLMTRSWFAR